VADGYDDHYWDVVAQRQFLKVMRWLEGFISPEFRARVWQSGTKSWEYYEETMTEFFDDFSIEGLLVDGLARLGISANAVTCLARFTNQFDAFNETISHPVDAKGLESTPAFQEVVAEARNALSILTKAQKSMRTVVDDL
jgi:hypothetical protein